ncbi:MAG: Coq4 family protein [Planctomycetota bacterium]|nr:Coq4 family protein [Planctomycetota bacterium]
MLEKLLWNHRKHHTHQSYLTLVRGAVGMMLDPEHTSSVFDIEDGLRNSPSSMELLRFSAKDPGVEAMIRERYLQPIPDTDRLRQLPLGTLGRRYTDHLDSMGFDPDYYRKIDVRDDVDYVMMRIRQTHDVWHVVTGFDTHPLGEICVKAVELAQTHRPMAAAICAGGIFRYMLHKPEEFGACIESIAAGYHLGLVARPLLAMKWEEMWERPVEDVRAELNVRPLGAHGGVLSVSFAPGEHAAYRDATARHDEASRVATRAMGIDVAEVEAMGDALQKLKQTVPGLAQHLPGEKVHVHRPLT